jgi:outer membrane receptor protein involved in Fe transport
MSYLDGILCAGLLALVPCTMAAQEPEPDVLALDSLLNTPIDASGKYQQTAREAASSVTIVTHEQIEHFGYRTLNDVLQGVSGFYLSNDRNYSYLGARGFSRPTDYNNRILLLIDGHQMNEGIWGSAPLELPIDPQYLERVEIVRGPGSALYGTGAIFGVINLVTRSGASIGGSQAAVLGGSYGQRSVSAAFGRRTDGGTDLELTGTWEGSDGQDLYFPEYDTPETNNGIAHNLDWDRNSLVQMKASRGDWSLNGWSSSRSKAIPTGAYETQFDAQPTLTIDRYAYAELKYEHALDVSKRIRVRGFFDRYAYDGAYAYVGADQFERSRDESIGSEASLHWDLGSAQRLTAGVEYRRHLRARYDIIGGGNGFSVPYDVASAFVEHEFQPTRHLSFLGGLRADHYSTTGGSLTPRAAVLYDPAPGTTLKLLYGRAFRAPNLYEARNEGGDYRLNPSLHAERGYTLELALQQRMGAGLLGTASTFFYDIDGLIDQTLDPADGKYLYVNRASYRARGAELGLEARLGGGVLGYGKLTYQHASDETTGGELTNSPSFLAKAGISAPLGQELGGALEGRFESSRLTVYDTRTEAYALGNLHLWLAPRVGGSTADRLQLSLRINNFLNALYATPGGVEHLEPGIQQDRRNFSAELRYRF